MKPAQAFDANPMLLVQSVMAVLTKTERKVAELILHDPEFVMFASITDVAERASVGETTVIRVCRKLGFRGYQEFKLSIARHIASPAEAAGGPVRASDTLEVALQKIAAYNVQTLTDTTKLLRAADVAKAADMVLGAARVYVFGVGSSGITALDLRYRLMRIGVTGVSEADAHTIAMLCALAQPADVIVGISVTGTTKDLNDALQIAKRRRADIICVTNHARSPITHLADVSLLTSARESPLQGGALGTKIAQMQVLDALASAIALKSRGRSDDALERTAAAVVDKKL